MIKQFKKILLNIFFYLYRNEYYIPVSKEEVDKMLVLLKTTKGLEKLPAYLAQCSNNARNKYMYTNDDLFKGVVLAFTTLREEIESDKKKPKKKLTPEQEVSILRARGY